MQCQRLFSYPTSLEAIQVNTPVRFVPLTSYHVSIDFSVHFAICFANTISEHPIIPLIQTIKHWIFTDTLSTKLLYPTLQLPSRVGAVRECQLMCNRLSLCLCYTPNCVQGRPRRLHTGGLQTPEDIVDINCKVNKKVTLKNVSISPVRRADHHGNRLSNRNRLGLFLLASKRPFCKI